MNELKYIVELKPIYDSRKSYYGKANILIYNDGSMALKSYDTIVSRFENGKVVDLGKWSQTTTRHQKEFRRQFEKGE